jgi:predicted RNA-binding protein YlqC (UPF0109 family)
MKDLLDLIIKNITLHPDEAVIDEQDMGDSVVYTIHVHSEDMGRVIGKSGKVIKAIRSLSHVAGIRHNKHFRINVAESGQPLDQEAEAGSAIDMQAPTEELTAQEVEPSSDDSDIIAQALDSEEA